jgi:hypothetical protein
LKYLENIVKGEEENLGQIIGINLKPVDFSDYNQLSIFIESISKLKAEKDTTFYIEGIENISKEIILEIERETGLIYKSGDNTRILNIPQIIIKVYDILEEDYNSKETLVICSDKERLLHLLQILSNYFKFLSVFGLDESIQDEIYEEILQSTGISIFQPVNIERLIKIYNIIINFNDEIDFDLSNIRNDVLIIDFSEKKPFNSLGKKGVIIKDINFQIGFENILLENYVSPSLLEGLNEDRGKIFAQINVVDSFYYVEEIIETRIRLKGKF